MLSRLHYLRASYFAASFFIYELPPLVLHFPSALSILQSSSKYHSSPSSFNLRVQPLLPFVPRSNSTYLDSIGCPFPSRQRNEVLPFSRGLLYEPLAPSIPGPCHFAFNYPPKRLLAAKIRRTNPIYPITDGMFRSCFSFFIRNPRSPSSSRPSTFLFPFLSSSTPSVFYLPAFQLAGIL